MFDDALDDSDSFPLEETSQYESDDCFEIDEITLSSDEEVTMLENDVVAIPDSPVTTKNLPNGKLSSVGRNGNETNLSKVTDTCLESQKKIINKKNSRIELLKDNVSKTLNPCRDTDESTRGMKHSDSGQNIDGSHSSGAVEQFLRLQRGVMEQPTLPNETLLGATNSSFSIAKLTNNNRFSFPGDFNYNTMYLSKKAAQCLQVHKDVIKKKNAQIRTLNQRNRRLTKKLEKLQSVIIDLLEKDSAIDASVLRYL